MDQSFKHRKRDINFQKCNSMLKIQIKINHSQYFDHKQTYLYISRVENNRITNGGAMLMPNEPGEIVTIQATRKTALLTMAE